MDLPVNTEDVLTPEQVAEKGQQIYAQLRPELEPTNRGKYLVIEVGSGDYFMADSVLDAVHKAQEKYPNKLFHTVRIGYEGLYKMGSYSSKGLLYGWDLAR